MAADHVTAHARSTARSNAALCGAACLIAHLALTGCSTRNEPNAGPIVRGDARCAVIALGNLSGAAAPSSAQVELSMFFFGTPPEPALGPIKPVDLALAGETLLVCDGAFGGTLAWNASQGRWSSAGDASINATAIAADAHGGWYIADASGARVRHCDERGQTVHLFQLPDEAGAFRPTGVAAVDGELWVSNAAQHRIEIFDLATRRWSRSIGGRGDGPGQFGLPMGLAHGRDGNVFVVDMLNARVQVLARDGRWLHDIGGPGDRIGRFGRPRSVAIGPDGVVFVVDAASQRVHAFTPEGEPLLAFGDVQDGRDALVLPAGIAISPRLPQAQTALPAGFSPAYFVLVAEQLARPGVRAYAWRSGTTAALNFAPRRADTPTPRVQNPHWQTHACRTCHTEPGPPTRIAAERVDALCIACHDGVRARAEVHPVGVPGATPRTRVPDDRPFVDGRIGCLTCHDIAQHCDAAAKRPRLNAALVRGFERSNPSAACLNCHVSETWRVNPHRPESPTAAQRACSFCHATPAPQAPAGVRRGAPQLRDQATRLCLNCHAMHADPAPRGHLGQPVSSVMQALPRVSELPLEGGAMTCATCHNPHAREQFPQSSALGAYSSSPADARDGLRLEHAALCLSCHPN